MTAIFQGHVAEAAKNKYATDCCACLSCSSQNTPTSSATKRRATLGYVSVLALHKGINFCTNCACPRASDNDLPLTAASSSAEMVRPTKLRTLANCLSMCAQGAESDAGVSSRACKYLSKRRRWRTQCAGRIHFHDQPAIALFPAENRK